MSDVERESENLDATTPLELNKETLQDLDIETTAGENVKGGVSNIGGRSKVINDLPSVVAGSMPV